MVVHVKLYAQLRKYHPGPNRSVALGVTLADGASVADLIGVLDLPRTLIGAPFVNDAKCGLGAVLHDGDRVSLFSPVVGGAR